MILVLVIVACFLLILYNFLNNTYDYWKKRNVPFHPPVTFFGNVGDSLTMKRSLGQIYADIYNLYQDLPYVGMYKIRQPVLLIKDADIAKNILMTDFYHFDKNDLSLDPKLDPIMSKNPFFLSGSHWKATRSQLSQCFTSGKMKHLFPLMHEVSENMVKYIEKEIKMGGNPIDAKELAGKFTTDNVASCAFGIEGKSFEDSISEIRNYARQIFQSSTGLQIKFLIGFLFPSTNTLLRVKFLSEKVANYFTSLIETSLKYRKENSVVRNDFLDILTQLKLKSGGSPLSIDEVTAHSLSFFVDGFETSAVTLHFALYDLAAHQDIQKKLRNSIEEVLKKHDGILSYDALQEIKYLDCVLSESMRLHPSFFDMTKVCTKEYILPPCKNNPQGTRLEQNTRIVIPVYAMHHDAKYFPNPEEFDPERFSESNKLNIIKGSYLPFSEGPRTCLGMRFAILQVKIAIAAIIRNFEVRVNKKTKEPLEIDPTNFLLHAKGGIWLDYYKLNQSDNSK